MGVVAPLCRRASGCCIVRLCRASTDSRTPVVAGKAVERAFAVEVFQCGLPLTVPSFLKLLRLMPRLLQPNAACRPAKPSACPLKTGTTLPGGKAAVSLRLRRADRNVYRKWTSEYTDIDTLSYHMDTGTLRNIPTICPHAHYSFRYGHIELST